MHSNVNHLFNGKPCTSIQYNVSGGLNNVDTHARLDEQAEAFFDKYIFQYTLDELRAHYQTSLDMLSHRTIIHSYLASLSAESPQVFLSLNELQLIIQSVIQKRLIHLALVRGFKTPEVLFDDWSSILINLTLEQRVDLHRILKQINSRGCIEPNNYSSFEYKLQPVQRMCEIAEQLGICEGLTLPEISACVIHAFFAFIDREKVEPMQTFTPPVVKEHDVPVNGYNEINTTVAFTQETRQEYLIELLTKLNPASRFQVFKFVNHARFLTPEQLVDLAFSQSSVAQFLFPTEDVTVMRQVINEVRDAYAQTFNEPFTTGHWLHLVVMIWSERERFYVSTEFAWVDKHPMDTSFTDIILGGLSTEKFLDGFNEGLINHVIDKNNGTLPETIAEAFYPNESDDLDPPPRQREQGEVGRAGMAVKSPANFLQNLARVRNNAIQKAIDEINSILDNDEYVRSIASYDLGKGKVILELKLQSPLDGILSDVMKTIEQAGWGVSSNMGDNLCLEVSSASYL